MTAYEAAELHVDLKRRLWATCLNFAAVQPHPLLPRLREGLLLFGEVSILVLRHSIELLPFAKLALVSPAELGSCSNRVRACVGSRQGSGVALLVAGKAKLK